jgi:hypothetical protein
LATAIDVGIFAIVMGLLTRAIHERVGTTDVATLNRLQETAPATTGQGAARVAVPEVVTAAEMPRAQTP